MEFNNSTTAAYAQGLVPTNFYVDDEDYSSDNILAGISQPGQNRVKLPGSGKDRNGFSKSKAQPPSMQPLPGMPLPNPALLGKPGAGRTRPTNNQLLYKAYFRWAHYSHSLKRHNLPLETDACASVTAAFLQVLQILHNAEMLKVDGPKRNVLQLLSTNTRRTKVVELSSGTHRVPEELKKHFLSDGENGQYSTNLDRNRYGNDDNYLFTVIRYDLEFLNICPCMVDVEIIDAKAGNQSLIVSAGEAACTCRCLRDHEAATSYGAIAHQAPPMHPMPIASSLPPPPAHSHAHGLGSSSLRNPSSLPLSMASLPTSAGAGLLGDAGMMRSGMPVNSGIGGGGGGKSHSGLSHPYGSNKGYGSDIMGGIESPKRSSNSVSQLFDALVMVAAGPHDMDHGDLAGGDMGPISSPGQLGHDPLDNDDIMRSGDHGLGGMGVGNMGVGGSGEGRLLHQLHAHHHHQNPHPHSHQNPHQSHHNQPHHSHHHPSLNPHLHPSAAA
eukprot:CAMPEP_0175046700 /NCGR_PEP_ID=MMETSP0052_2-20121109/5176_1 /TAXON_ID=51329 ORGANISM="Polytomella parva, Strain SAG 63-3" /NCGR_SAMPLE_ID=MMETSP0052_2 /ASSEMBLY_ACC=CAM_ASM_000194 /LENGTH=496 /DNA_ID=CAMNT_0016310475 /DNA_START=18 /DNA_END=1505 /DNA_ORIENTATION=+